MSLIKTLGRIFTATSPFIPVRAVPTINVNQPYKITPKKLELIHTKLPQGPGADKILQVTDFLPRLGQDAWIAGGAPRRLLYGRDLDKADVDFFFRNASTFLEYEKIIKKQGAELVIKTGRANTYRLDGVLLQLIKRSYYGNLVELFYDFDFTVCQVAYDGQDLVLSKYANDDLSSNTLRYFPEGTVDKHSAVQRLIKYMSYGFEPEAELYRTTLAAGMDNTSIYDIFNSTSGQAIMSFYDIDAEMNPDDIIRPDQVNANVLRELIKNLETSE